jgi:hypothetical protein
MQHTQNDALQVFTATLQADDCLTVFSTEQLNCGLLLAHVDGGCVYSRDGRELLQVTGEWAQGEVSWRGGVLEYERDGGELFIEIDVDTDDFLCYDDTDEGWAQMAQHLMDNMQLYTE